MPINPNLWREKESESGESNRRRPVTSLTPCRWAKPVWFGSVLLYVHRRCKVRAQGCVKVEVAVLSIPPHIILMVSVDAKHHCIKRTIRLIRVGVPRTATSTFTQLLTELWRNRLTLVLLIRRVVSGSQRVSGGDRDTSRWADDDDAELHVLGCRLTY